MVTGAAGFIGSHFVDYVLENHPEDQVIGFDCLTYAGNMQNLESAISNKRFQFIKGDIRNTDQVDSVIRKIDAIVNFAAETHVDRSINSSGEFISTNVLGVNVLLEAALNQKIQLFHQISTDEVYGSRENGFSKEEDKLKPSSPYSASKAAADLLVESFYVTHGLNIKITRSSNNFGIRQNPEKLIPNFINQLINEKHVTLYGDGKNIRNWLDVRDHCRAVDLVFRSTNDFRIINISSEEYFTNLEITQAIVRLLNKNMDYVDFIKDRKGHDYRYAVDISRLKNFYHFETKYNFTSELQNLVNTYL